MVWGAFSALGCLELQFTTTRMNSQEYIDVLQKSLVPFLKRNRQKKIVFQQDNARIHVSRETMDWFSSNKINVMDWPACSPDLNPIENLWGIMVRRVYENNRHFETTDELKAAIKETWNSIDRALFQSLAESMNNRIFEVIRKGGKQLGK